MTYFCSKPVLMVVVLLEIVAYWHPNRPSSYCTVLELLSSLLNKLKIKKNKFGTTYERAKLKNGHLLRINLRSELVSVSGRFSLSSSRVVQL
jgi:hypothetical protein